MSIDITVTTTGKPATFGWPAFAHYMVENAESSAWMKATKWVLARIEVALTQYALRR